jgi:lysozyme
VSNLIEMLKRHEGVRPKVYVCSAGYETIAVGRNISESGLGLSDDEIDYLLTNDIDRVVSELDSTFSWFKRLNPARKDAMISICFNLGLTRLLKFKNALSFMESEDYIMAGMEFDNSLWSKQVGQRAEELCQMIESGEYQNDAA